MAAAKCLFLAHQRQGAAAEKPAGDGCFLPYGVDCRNS
jgi:hypothetical protein